MINNIISDKNLIEKEKKIFEIIIFFILLISCIYIFNIFSKIGAEKSYLESTLFFIRRRKIWTVTWNWRSGKRDCWEQAATKGRNVTGLRGSLENSFPIRMRRLADWFGRQPGRTDERADWPNAGHMKHKTFK